MLYRLAADSVMLLHFEFVLFVIVGGFLTWRWRWLVWLHIPSVIWAVITEFCRLICPLTPLENALRIRAGLNGYVGGFVDHYLGSVLYPEALTPFIQIVLGTLVILINLIAYAPHLLRLVRRPG